MVDNVDESALNFIELCFDGRIELAAGCLEKQGTGAEGRVGDDLKSPGQIQALDELTDRGEAPRIGAELVDLTLIEPLKGSFHKPCEGVGVDGEFAVQDATGNRDGEADQVFLCLTAQLRAAGCKVPDHMAQFGEFDFELFFKELAGRLIAVTAAGSECLLNAAVPIGMSGLQFRPEGRNLRTQLNDISQLVFGGVSWVGSLLGARACGRPFDGSEWLDGATNDLGQHRIR